MKPSKGICYLIGAGPGDVGLVTLKAKECIEKANILVYDALIAEEFIRWVAPQCELIYVGKRSDQHALSQEKINQLLVEKTALGHLVVRLKGGDPTIFGRGGEEAKALSQAQQEFQIIPGISSALAGPLYAGIPLTHREHCSQLTIFTGHEDPHKENSKLDYNQIAKAPGTRVVLMGVSRLRTICEELIVHGAANTTPIALIRWATTSKQRTIVGTLKTIADLAEKKQFAAPAIAVIGDVVNERKDLTWFENRPLFGKKIVVTRTRTQASELSSKLTDLGADVLEIPTIKIEHPNDRESFASSVGNAHTYDWIVFTSPNGVTRFFDAFFKVYNDARCIGGARIATVGPGTAKKVNEYHLAVDLIPAKHVAENLVETFAKKENIENQTILWVRGEEGRDIVSQGLKALGGIVDECVAYQTLPEHEDLNGMKEKFVTEGADLITFVSSSAATNFFNLDLPWKNTCEIASIGPITSKTLEILGKPPHLEAKKHDIDGLVSSIVEYFNS